MFDFVTPLKGSLATLAFFDIFDRPLSLDELQKWSLGEKFSLEDLKQKISGFSESDGDFVFLKGRKEIVASYLAQEKLRQKFDQRVAKFVPLLRFIPFVRMVAVCNSVALGTVDQRSDIDLFIVTEKDRIFLSRVLATLFFHVLGIRRHGAKIVGRFCLSFYVSESAMNLKPLLLDPYDIYFAYWFLTLQPMVGGDLFEHFFAENDWIDQYFLEVETRKNVLPQRVNWLQSVFELFLKGKFGDWIESKLAKFFIARHQQRKTTLSDQSSVVVSSQLLKFHNIDRREDFRVKFENRLKELGFV